MKEIIRQVQELGFTVYMRNPDKDTWLYYTNPEGTAIGYLQMARLTDGVDISTVHIPSTQHGSGVRALDGATITRGNLEQGLRRVPDWYTKDRDAASVRKYRDINHFIESSNYNKEYKEVPRV